MKSRVIVFLILALAASAFIVNHLRRPVDDAPRVSERHEQMRKEVMDACTNEVPGISHILEVNYDDSSTNVSDWKASARLEFVNARGGVERTNLNFHFQGFGAAVICLPDHKI